MVRRSWGVAHWSPHRSRIRSALAGTELDRLFRLRDVNTLVLTGAATQFAVEGTAREVHRFSIDVILRNLYGVTTVERFIRSLERDRP